MYLLDGSANRTLIPIAIGRVSQRKSNQGSDAGLIIFLTIFKLTYFQICVFIPLPYLCDQNNPDILSLPVHRMPCIGRQA